MIQKIKNIRVRLDGLTQLTGNLRPIKIIPSEGEKRII